MATDVINSIGSAGRDYAAANAWEADTQANLPPLDERRIGELYDDSDFTTLCNVAGATTDATRYRFLRTASGHQFNLITGTGSKFVHSAARSNGVVQANEPYCRLQGFLVESQYAGSETNRGIRMRDQFCWVDSVVVSIPDGTGSTVHGIQIHTNNDQELSNAVVLGGGSGQGLTHGIIENSSTGFLIVHCTVINVQSGAGIGYSMAGATGLGINPSDFYNNSAFDCGTGYSYTLGTEITASNNAGDDDPTNIPGGSSQGNLDPVDEFLDYQVAWPIDLRLHQGSALVDAGGTGFSTFSYNGKSIESGVFHGDASGTNNIGPYDGRYADLGAITIPIVISGVGVLALRAKPEPGPISTFRFLSIHWLQGLCRLLPPGKLFRPRPEALCKRLLEAQADELFRVSERGIDVLTESDPRLTDELLADFERNWGLPEQCEPDPFSLTAEQRRAALLRKMRSQGVGSSPTEIVSAAASLGFLISIQTYQPMRAGGSVPDGGSRAGDALTQNSAGWAHVWTVSAPLDTVREFKAGQGRCNEPLRVWGNEILECMLETIKPSHTRVTFVYGAEETLLAGQPDPSTPAPPPGPGEQTARQIFAWPF